jgi:hypothetical protein
MAETGWISASAGANGLSGGGSPALWTAPGNILASDGSRALVALNNKASYYLMAAFDGIAANVPAEATIDGIVLRVKGYATTAVDSFVAYLGTSAPSLMDSGSAVKDVGASLPIGSSTNEAVVEVGGAADLWSQSSIDRATVADSAFRVLLKATDAGATTVYVNHVQIKVHYTYTPPAEPQDSIALFWSAP